MKEKGVIRWVDQWLEMDLTIVFWSKDFLDSKIIGKDLINNIKKYLQLVSCTIIILCCIP